MAKIVLAVISVHGRLYKPFNATITKTYIIDKYHFLKYNYQLLNLKNKRNCVENVRFLYFNAD